MSESANPETAMERLAKFCEDEAKEGIRTTILNSYHIPMGFYLIIGKAAKTLDTLGSLIYYGLELGYMGHTKRSLMNVDAVVQHWRTVIVGLATAHDKDEADRYEAAVDECLTPILSAPIKQIRDFYPKLLAALKDDPAVPFLVWRGYEIWIEMVISKAPDEDIKQLKADLAKEIADLVEKDVKDQLPDALIRALMWRSAETLEKVKAAVTESQTRGEKARLRGRESCLFLEVGGTLDNPAVCVQI